MAATRGSGLPKSDLGSEAHKYMKARKADAQKLIDEAAKFDATLTEALNYAGRQLRAALRAKRVYEAELVKERELMEKEEQERQDAGEVVDESLAARLWLS